LVSESVEAPHSVVLSVLRRPWGLLAVRASPMGVGVTTQSDSGSVGARPIGGACGPCRTAVKTYRKFLQPAGSRLVRLRLMRYAAASTRG
jgi:hypothetical protein